MLVLTCGSGSCGYSGDSSCPHHLTYRHQRLLMLPGPADSRRARVWTVFMKWKAGHEAACVVAEANGRVSLLSVSRTSWAYSLRQGKGFLLVSVYKLKSSDIGTDLENEKFSHLPPSTRGWPARLRVATHVCFTRVSRATPVVLTCPDHIHLPDLICDWKWDYSVKSLETKIASVYSNYRVSFESKSC